MHVLPWLKLDGQNLPSLCWRLIELQTLPDIFYKRGAAGLQGGKVCRLLSPLSLLPRGSPMFPFLPLVPPSPGPWPAISLTYAQQAPSVQPQLRSGVACTCQQGLGTGSCPPFPFPQPTCLLPPSCLSLLPTRPAPPIPLPPLPPPPRLAPLGPRGCLPAVSLRYVQQASSVGKCIYGSPPPSMAAG